MPLRAVHFSVQQQYDDGMAHVGNHKEIAFYYPGPIWHGSDWIKTLILFFDGVGHPIAELHEGQTWNKKIRRRQSL